MRRDEVPIAHSASSSSSRIPRSVRVVKRSSLKGADVTRIVGKLNTIWNQAGIHFGLESIVREPAAQRERFRLMAELQRGELEMSDFQLLLPRQCRVFDGLHAYFFHELPFNGAYLGDDCAIVQEGARLKAVEGGNDEPLPRVLGFALGQALSLQARREPETSLMASGTTGVRPSLRLGRVRLDREPGVSGGTPILLPKRLVIGPEPAAPLG
jgi:hypothetical protein